MHIRKPTARHASDGRLVFAHMAIVIGLTMVTGSLLEPQPAIGLPLRGPPWSAPTAAVRTLAVVPLAFTTRHDLAARVPHWALSMASIPQHRARDGIDPCRELLMLASLQRRAPRERPVGHYAALAPESGADQQPWQGCWDRPGNRQRGVR